MKERYETPEMEIVKFEVEDIIRTSDETQLTPNPVNDESDLNQYLN